MYRLAGMIGMVVIASPFAFGYYASDLVGLWYSIVSGFGLVLLAVEALRGERSEREHHVAGSRRAGDLCPVVVRANDYGLTRRQSFAVLSSMSNESIYGKEY